MPSAGSGVKPFDCIGREQEINELTAGFNDPQSARLIVAPPYMGKSTLLKEIVWRARSGDFGKMMVGYYEIPGAHPAKTSVFLYVLKDLFFHIYNSYDFNSQAKFIFQELESRFTKDGAIKLLFRFWNTVKTSVGDFLSPVKPVISMADFVVDELRRLDVGTAFELLPPFPEDEVKNFLEPVLNCLTDKKVLLVLDNFSALCTPGKTPRDLLTALHFIGNENPRLHLLFSARREVDMEGIPGLGDEISRRFLAAPFLLDRIDDKPALETYIRNKFPDLITIYGEPGKLADLTGGYPGVFRHWKEKSPCTAGEIEQLAIDAINTNFRYLGPKIETLPEDEKNLMFYLIGLRLSLPGSDFYAELLNISPGECEKLFASLKLTKLISGGQGVLYSFHDLEKEWLDNYLETTYPSKSNNIHTQCSEFFEIYISYPGNTPIMPLVGVIECAYHSKKAGLKNKKDFYTLLVQSILNGDFRSLLSHRYFKDAPAHIRAMIISDSLKDDPENMTDRCNQLIGIDTSSLRNIEVIAVASALFNAVNNTGMADIEKMLPLVEEIRALAYEEKWADEILIQENYTSALVNAIDNTGRADIEKMLPIVEEIRALAYEEKWADEILIQENYAKALVNAVNNTGMADIEKMLPLVEEIRALAGKKKWADEILIQENYAKALVNAVNNTGMADIEKMLPLVKEIRELAGEEKWADEILIQENYAEALFNAVVYTGRVGIEKMLPLVEEIRALACEEKWADEILIQENYAGALFNAVVYTGRVGIEKMLPLVEEIRALACEEKWADEILIQENYAEALVNAVGYTGRVGIEKMLPLVEEIRALAGKKKWADEILIQENYAKALFNAVISSIVLNHRGKIPGFFKALASLAEKFPGILLPLDPPAPLIVVALNFGESLKNELSDEKDKAEIDQILLSLKDILKLILENFPPSP